VKRTIATATAVLLLAGTAHAEDAVLLTGNYYLERSTRVIAPTVSVFKDVGEGQARFTYLVDQITSASGAFTVTDEPFSEYRQDLSLSYTHPFTTAIGKLTPGIGVRYSHESDYRSHAVSLQSALELPNRTTTLQARADFRYDIIGQRARAGFRDTLHTLFLSFQATQVLTGRWMAGTALGADVLRGYQENVYRVEQHPRERERYALTAWTAYRFPSKTTARVEYTYGFGTWKLKGHTIGLTVTQQILPWFEIQPTIRYHTQGGVFFEELVDNFITTDPKLRELETALVGGQLMFYLRFLNDTPLDFMAGGRIQPAYYFFHQTNRYGDAHIAQLTLYAPF
jgi:hypothetical protein